ncbi:hypothetical protein HDU98_000481 [Podochytrium sp. JEL0797]|nr:hypothetical protein HDU98_000481 [Podochytrium sp. JEL0797]
MLGGQTSKRNRDDSPTATSKRVKVTGTSSTSKSLAEGLASPSSQQLSVSKSKSAINNNDNNNISTSNSTTDWDDLVATVCAANTLSFRFAALLDGAAVAEPTKAIENAELSHPTSSSEPAAPLTPLHIHPPFPGPTRFVLEHIYENEIP